MQIPEGLAGISVLANGKRIKFNHLIIMNKANG